MSPFAPVTRRGMLERAVHDIKNPLSVVRSTLEYLEIEVADRPDALDAVRDAMTASARLLVLVDDLDMLGRLEGMNVVARNTVDVGATIGQVSASAAEILGTRGISLATLAPTGLIVKGEVALVRRAIESLVEVSARGTSTGACVEIDARIAAAQVEIEVGVRGAELTGAEEVSIDALASSGLGGYLAFRVAEAHGGSLHVMPTATLPRVIMRLPLAP